MILAHLGSRLPHAPLLHSLRHGSEYRLENLLRDGILPQQHAVLVFPYDHTCNTWDTAVKREKVSATLSCDWPSGMSPVFEALEDNSACCARGMASRKSLSVTQKLEGSAGRTAVGCRRRVGLFQALPARDAVARRVHHAARHALANGLGRALAHGLGRPIHADTCVTSSERRLSTVYWMMSAGSAAQQRLTPTQARPPPAGLGTCLPEAVCSCEGRTQNVHATYALWRRHLLKPRSTVLFAVLPEAVEGAAVGPGEDADPVLLTVGPLPVIALSCGPLEGALRTMDFCSES